MIDFSATLAAAAALLSATAATAHPSALPLDVETSTSGVPVACTGVGQTRLEPKWQAFPVRVEFANARSEYLGGGEVIVRDAHGHEVLSASCEAPWVLMKLPPGVYTVEARIPNANAKSRTAPFSPPKAGQMRLVLAFPEGQAPP